MGKMNGMEGLPLKGEDPSEMYVCMSSDFLLCSFGSPNHWRSSHLLAQSRDVSRCFYYSLTAVVVFVELGAEGCEHGHERWDWGWGLGSLIVAARVLGACHCGLEFGEVSIEVRAEFGILRAAESEQCFTEVSPWPQWHGGQILDTA